MNLLALISELQGERQWLEIVIQALETASPDDPLLKELLRDLDAVTRPGGALRLDDRKKLELFRQAEALIRRRRRTHAA